MMRLRASKYRLARSSQPGIAAGPGNSHARQASEKGSNTPVRREMLPMSAAFFGTSRTSVKTKNNPPKMNAAGRRVPPNKNPTPHSTQIAPNK